MILSICLQFVGLCLSVCLSRLRCANTAKRIEVVVRVETLVDPRNTVGLEDRPDFPADSMRPSLNNFGHLIASDTARFVRRQKRRGERNEKGVSPPLFNEEIRRLVTSSPNCVRGDATAYMTRLLMMPWPTINLAHSGVVEICRK